MVTSPNRIDAAVERLKSERAIDDVRVAEAIARTETAVKRRGRLRVRRQIEHAGIAPTTARRAVDEIFEDIDDRRAASRLPSPNAFGTATIIADDREFQKLYRYLIAQGFEADSVMLTLTARRRQA